MEHRRKKRRKERGRERDTHTVDAVMRLVAMATSGAGL